MNLFDNIINPYVSTDPYARGENTKWSFAIYLIDTKSGKYSEADAFGDFKSLEEAIEVCEMQPIYSEEYDGLRLEVWDTFMYEGSRVRESKMHTTQRDPDASAMLPHFKALASVFLT